MKGRYLEEVRRLDAVAKALFLAEHPKAQWQPGRARWIWFARAQAAIEAADKTAAVISDADVARMVEQLTYVADNGLFDAAENGANVDFAEVAEFIRRLAVERDAGKRKPHCSTCGCDVPEVLCAKCGGWWRDNDPAVQQAVLAERERCAPRVVDALWPVLGGNHTDAQTWQAISDAIAKAIWDGGSKPDAGGEVVGTPA